MDIKNYGVCAICRKELIDEQLGSNRSYFECPAYPVLRWSGCELDCYHFFCGGCLHTLLNTPSENPEAELESMREDFKTAMYGEMCKKRALEKKWTQPYLRSVFDAQFGRIIDYDRHLYWDIFPTCRRCPICRFPFNGHAMDDRRRHYKIQRNRQPEEASELYITAKLAVEAMIHPLRMDEIIRSRRRGPLPIVYTDSEASGSDCESLFEEVVVRRGREAPEADNDGEVAGSSSSAWNAQPKQFIPPEASPAVFSPPVEPVAAAAPPIFAIPLPKKKGTYVFAKTKQGMKVYQCAKCKTPHANAKQRHICCKSFKCEYCQKTYDRPSRLKEHMDKEHKL